MRAGERLILDCKKFRITAFLFIARFYFRECWAPKSLRRSGARARIANLGLVPNVRNMFGVLRGLSAKNTAIEGLVPEDRKCLVGYGWC